MPAAPYVEALILGILQGITEFLPVSSDGHLVVFGSLLGELLGTGPIGEGSERMLLMTIVLHVGTLASLLVVFRSELWSLLRDRQLCVHILVATCTTALLGLPFKKAFEATFDEPLVAAAGWLLTAGFLWYSQKVASNTRERSQMRFSDALAIGGLQALAPLPGVSRSGSTIAAALFMGLNRQAAASFSFLIAIPAVAGAAALELGPPLVRLARGAGLNQALPGVPLDAHALCAAGIGAFISFVVGVAALRWLLAVIARRGLNGFALYCVLAALATVIWQLAARAEF
jgi:undecaprenyl-diphosphatase